MVVARLPQWLKSTFSWCFFTPQALSWNRSINFFFQKTCSFPKLHFFRILALWVLPKRYRKNVSHFFLISQTLVHKFIFRTLEDDEKLLRVVSCWKPQTSNRLIFSQRTEKYDLFRRPERYLLDPYDKATTEAVMQTPWDPVDRQSLLQRCIGMIYREFKSI